MSNLRKVGKHTLGVICILFVVFLWVASAEICESIFNDNDFNNAFFLTYFSTSMFLIYMLLFIRLFFNECRKSVTGRNEDIIYASLSENDSSSSSSKSPNDKNGRSVLLNQNNTIQENDGPIMGENSPPNPDSIINQNEIDTSVGSIQSAPNNSSKGSKHETKSWFDTIFPPKLPEHQLSLSETFKISAIFCPVWFLMEYLYNGSLAKTSVASSTVLSTMSGPFSLMLSRCILKSKLSILNFGGVLITLMGAGFIGYLDKSSSTDNNTLYGDILALISAFIYGFYVTLLKYKIKDESKMNVFLFFALLGLINVLTLWPIMFLLNELKLEMFIFPSKQVFILLTINAIVSVLSDYFWVLGIFLTNPVIATVGLSLTMPVAMFGDEIIRHQTHSVPYWIGSFSVMIGFILVNADLKMESNNKDNDKELDTQD